MELLLKCYYDQKITFVFSSDFEAVFVEHSAGGVVGLDFERRTVDLGCGFPV